VHLQPETVFLGRVAPTKLLLDRGPRAVPALEHTDTSQRYNGERSNHKENRREHIDTDQADDGRCNRRCANAVVHRSSSFGAVCVGSRRTEIRREPASYRRALARPSGHLTSTRIATRAVSFDHLVGAGEERRWYREAEYPCGLSIDDKLKLARLHNRHIYRLRAF
jgi:hypothetical protein